MKWPGWKYFCVKDSRNAATIHSLYVCPICAATVYQSGVDKHEQWHDMITPGGYEDPQDYRGGNVQIPRR